MKTLAERMHHETRPDHEGGWPAMVKVASEEPAEIKRLKRENAERRRVKAILKAASAFSAAELYRPGQ